MSLIKRLWTVTELAFHPVELASGFANRIVSAVSLFAVVGGPVVEVGNLAFSPPGGAMAYSGGLLAVLYLVAAVRLQGRLDAVPGSPANPRRARIELSPRVEEDRRDGDLPNRDWRGLPVPFVIEATAQVLIEDVRVRIADTQYRVLDWNPEYVNSGVLFCFVSDFNVPPAKWTPGTRIAIEVYAEGEWWYREEPVPLPQSSINEANRARAARESAPSALL
jgi:hypothetical protein